MNFALSNAQACFLKKVEDSLETVLQENKGPLSKSSETLLLAARHLCLGSKAKRVRPLLAHSFSKILNLPDEKIISLAVSSELMHSASLLHDDVIDNAKTRRGRTTVNFEHGNGRSVLAGNFLLSVAFSLLKDEPNLLIHDSVEAIAYMAKAAICEMEVRGRLDLTLSEWREIAFGKTGVLFGWCGRSVARVKEDAEAVERFYQAGMHIGVAFQLADDLRDLQAKNTLKDRFADIRNREPSYPILFAVKNEDIKEALLKLWSKKTMDEEEISLIGKEILLKGSAKATSDAIEREVAAAIDSLGHFHQTEGGLSIEKWANELIQAAHSSSF